MHLTIHIDGGSRGNPGPAAAGVVITEAQTGRPLHEAGYFLGKMTNNAAEYQGLLHALRLAIEMKASSVSVNSDSQLMVNQITGEYRLKSADLRPLFEQAQALLLKIDTWQIRYIRREQNTRADELANLAMDAQRDVIQIAGGEVLATGKTAPVSANWVSVKLAADPGGACPARCDDALWYELGPATPQGLCAYAAKAVLDSVLDSPAPGKRVVCPHCRVPITIESAGGAV